MSGPRLAIAIDPDVNDLGWARKREAEPFPREFATLAWPVSWPYTVRISLPARMTAAEWDSLIGFLELTRDAIHQPDTDRAGGRG